MQMLIIMVGRCLMAIRGTCFCEVLFFRRLFITMIILSPCGKWWWRFFVARHSVCQVSVRFWDPSAVSQRIIWPSARYNTRNLHGSCVSDGLTNCYDIVSIRMPFAALCVCVRPRSKFVKRL